MKKEWCRLSGSHVRCIKMHVYFSNSEVWIFFCKYYFLILKYIVSVNVWCVEFWKLYFQLIILIFIFQCKCYSWVVWSCIILLIIIFNPFSVNSCTYSRYAHCLHCFIWGCPSLPAHYLYLHRPDLILHLQGQALQYLVSWCLHLGFTLRGHAGCYAGGLSELYHKCVTYVHKRLMICTLNPSVSMT